MTATLRLPGEGGGIGTYRRTSSEYILGFTGIVNSAIRDGGLAHTGVVFSNPRNQPAGGDGH